MEAAQRELVDDARKKANEASAFHEKPAPAGANANAKAARVPAAENKGSRLTAGRRASLIPSARRLSYGGELLPAPAPEEPAPPTPR